MKRTTVLIIDDEPLSRDLLRSFLNERNDIDLIGECGNGLEGLAKINKENPDLILLDIQMPDMNGIEMLDDLVMANSPLVVFTTAYDKYALKAFEINAIDYLLKPVTRERFNLAMDKAMKMLSDKDRLRNTETLMKLMDSYYGFKKEDKNKNQFSDRVLIKERKRLFTISASDISMLEADGDYVKIHSKSKSYLVNGSLNNYEGKLNPEVFVRIHRSSIVNCHYVKELQPLINGEFKIALHDGLEARISRSYKDKVSDLLGNCI
jgi:two-component system, LytTR family, response regulator